MMSFFAGLLPGGRISLERDRNLLGGAAPHYRCYRCADGREIAIGPLEPQFLAELLRRIEAPAELLAGCADPTDWPEQGRQLAELFAGKTQAEWCALLEGSDACFAPVLSLAEAARHPHMRQRGVYRDIDGVLHAAPAPRFSRTPGAIRGSVAASDWD
jgi:alpha-methylacyl-CoA racemase